MRLNVNVKRAVQEIDLDTGEESFYLVVILGGAEHRLPATDVQLQAALIEARNKQYAGSEASPLEELAEETPEEAPAFVEQLIEEPVSEEDVRAALLAQHSGSIDSNMTAFVHPPDMAETVVEEGVFSDISGLSEEELAEFQTQGSSQLPQGVQVSSDDGEEGATFEQIMQRPDGVDPDAAPSPQTQRKQNINKTREGHTQKNMIKAIRQRAKAYPVRGLPQHQVDEAGNPIVQQAKQSEALGFARPQYSGDPNAPEVRVVEGTVPAGFGAADEDGFVQG